MNQELREWVCKAVDGPSDNFLMAVPDKKVDTRKSFTYKSLHVAGDRQKRAQVLFLPEPGPVLLLGWCLVRGYYNFLARLIMPGEQIFSSK